MPIRSAKNGSFAVLLPELQSGSRETVTNELAKIFTILKRTASKIVDSAPIILLDDVSQEEANSIRRYFKTVSDIEILIHPSVSVNGVWARLNWPQRPKINSEILSGSHIFKETFGELEFSNSEAEIGEIVFNTEGSRTAETPATPAPTPSASTTVAKPATPASQPAPAPKKNKIPEFMQEQNDNNDAFCYSIFLSGTPSEAKKQRTIELICELKGISELEANELMSRTIVPIAKDMTKKQADEVQKLFNSSALNVRIMKKAK